MIDVDTLARIECIAWRAPSAHNTQPWRLVPEDDAIRIEFEPQRWLAVADPNRRDLLLSLGAFTEAFLIAAAGERRPCCFEPDIDIARHRIGRFRAAPGYATDYSADDLIARRTSRLAFAPAPLGAEAMADLCDALSTGHGVAAVNNVDLLPLLMAADRAVFADADVVGELRDWLRLSLRRDASPSDGLTAACLGLKCWQAAMLRAVLSERVYPTARRIGLPMLLAFVGRTALAHEGDTLVLTSERAGAADLIAAGRGLLRLWLTLARRGLHAQPLSQLIDFAGTREALGELVRLPAGSRILAVLRVGYSARPALSPRRH